ncbi:hypothetical protein D1872_307180 [compost metagenome]
MLRIMPFRLLRGNLNKLSGNQLKAFVLKTADNAPDQSSLNAVRLNHQKSTFHASPPDIDNLVIHEKSGSTGEFITILPKKRGAGKLASQ